MKDCAKCAVTGTNKSLAKKVHPVTADKLQTEGLPDLSGRRAAAEPFTRFEDWFRQATAAEINDPNGMAIATSDDSGLPNVRMVLLKGLDGAETANRGFVFYTNLESAKGRELLANPQAAILFHWKSLRRQVRARGVISAVSAAEADAYFATRPRQSQIGAWASDQSRHLETRAKFESEVGSVAKKFDGVDIPRPPHWSGFRLSPIEIEFWQDRPFRLHDRLVYRREKPDGDWVVERLYP
jgi:pyridoxamine 5'-phosphate oxidase